MAHIEYLKSLIDLRGKAIVDIGAGDGGFSRQLAHEGAFVKAIEVDPDKVAGAKAALPTAFNVMLGRAEELPLGDRSQDVACFFFSLHHVPEHAQAAAFDEAFRVLKPGGRLHVVEPYPYGTMFDVVRLVEDETLVRTRSHALLNDLGNGSRFHPMARSDYVLTREFPTFEAFFNRIINLDPDRRKAYSSAGDSIELTFNRVIEVVGGARILHQPCAAYHFQV